MIYAKVTMPQNGYPVDSQKANELIEQHGDNYIKVRNIQIGRSSTDVNLVGHTYRYNSVNFTFYVEDGDEFVEIDIFEMIHPDIQYTYAYF